LVGQWVGVTRQSHSIYAARLRLGLPRRLTHRPFQSPRNDGGYLFSSVTSDQYPLVRTLSPSACRRPRVAVALAEAQASAEEQTLVMVGIPKAVDFRDLHQTGQEWIKKVEDALRTLANRNFSEGRGPKWINLQKPPQILFLN